jgi:Tol biopolymer transport system component
LIYDAQDDRHRRQLLWVYRAGKPLRQFEHLKGTSVHALSPDQSGIVVARKDLTTSNNDLWLADAAGSTSVRFTFDPGSDLLGLWSPDAQRIVWTSTRNGSFDLYEKAVDGTGQDTRCSDRPSPSSRWTGRATRYLLVRQIHPRTNHDIVVLPMDGERKPFPHLQTPAMENGGAFSPEGKWMAYNSDESGRVEVYVEHFPTHGDALTTGTPTALFAFRAAGAVTVASYSPSRDGQRLLLSAIVESDPKAPLSVVQHWTSGLVRARR